MLTRRPSTGEFRTRWRGLRHHMGRLPAAGYIIHRLLQAVSGGRAGLVLYGLYAQPLRECLPAGLRADPRWQVDEVHAGDSIVSAFPRPSEVLQQRWAAGARCFVLTRDDRFAGYIWVQTGLYAEDEVRCDFVMPTGSATAWDYDVFLTPEHRLGRAMQRLWAHVEATLHAEGCRWSLSRISMFNPGSVRSHERLGAARIGWLLALVLPPLQLTLSSNRPWCHFSCSARYRPRLHVGPRMDDGVSRSGIGPGRA